MFDERNMMDRQFAGQSQLQEESSEQQTRMYAPQLREQIAEAQAAIIAQTNPSKALKIIIEGFRGNIINEDGEVEQIGNPIMNELGTARIATMLIPFISDPIRFGNIDEREVRNLALRIIDDITKEVGIRWREFGIQDSSSKDLIIDTLLALIFITLTRSEGQGEKNWLGRVVVESIGSAQKKKQGGQTWEGVKSLLKI